MLHEQETSVRQRVIQLEREIGDLKRDPCWPWKPYYTGDEVVHHWHLLELVGDLRERINVLSWK